MKTHYDEALNIQGPPPLDDAIALRRWAIAPLAYCSYWLATLYVITEGWRELDLEDRPIDNLLKSSHVNLLRRFRNGIFHFQKTYFDDRLSAFLTEKDALDWAATLHDELGRFFLGYLRTLGITWEVNTLSDGLVEVKVIRQDDPDERTH